MLERISWEQYITSLGSLLAVYYAALLAWHSIGKWKSNNQQLSQAPQPNLSAGASESQLHPPRQMADATLNEEAQYQLHPAPANKVREDSLLGHMYDLTYELKAYFSQVGKHAETDIIVDSVRSILKKYPSLTGTTFQPELDQFIREQAKQECGIDLDPALLYDVRHP